MVYLEIALIGITLALGLYEAAAPREWKDGRTKVHKRVRQIRIGLMVVFGLGAILVAVAADRAEQKAASQRAAIQTDVGKTSEKVDQVQTEVTETSEKVDRVLVIAQRLHPGESDIEALELLEKQLTDLEKYNEIVRQYSGMARLNILGVTGTAGQGLTESTPISRTQEGAWVVKDNTVTPTCDPESLNKYKAVIELEPRFPFPYYGLAACLRTANDSSWVGYAEQGVGVLEKTTGAPQQHAHHKAVLKKLEQWLSKR